MKVTEDYLAKKHFKLQEPLEFNMTTNIMLKSVNINIAFKAFRFFGFHNCYLSDAEFVEQKNCLFLVFNPSAITKEFQDFNNLMKSQSNYVYSYDADTNIVVYIFKVSSTWEKSLDKFMQSKYSEIDKDYISKYFHPLLPNGTRSKYYAILTKEQWYKEKIEQWIDDVLGDDQEVADMLYPEREVFRFKTTS